MILFTKKFYFETILAPQDENVHCTKKPRKEKEPPKILKGRFYQITCQKEGKVWAKCTECDEIKKGDENSTGNFIAHYRSKHPMDAIHQLFQS